MKKKNHFSSRKEKTQEGKGKEEEKSTGSDTMQIERERIDSHN